MQIPAARMFTTLIIVLLAANVSTAATEYPLRKGESIVEARAALLKAGWVPVRIDKRWDDGTRENQFGDARLFFDAGFIEVQECEGTGPNACILNYQKDGRCLQVITVGEYYRAWSDKPEVVRWTADCPD
jgi:hypothetical protein